MNHAAASYINCFELRMLHAESEIFAWYPAWDAAVAHHIAAFIHSPIGDFPDAAAAAESGALLLHLDLIGGVAQLARARVS